MVEKNDVANKVMEKIKGGSVKLRSKYVFILEKLSANGALVLVVALAALFFCLVIFYLKTSDNLAYLSFGRRGFNPFMQSFPYLLCGAFVGLIGAGVYIFKKSATGFQYPVKYVITALVVVVVAVGALLAYIDVGERFERRVFEKRDFGGRMFRPFLRSGLDERAGGIAGRVVQVREGGALIQTPRGEETVDLTKLENSLSENLSDGMFIVAVGDRRGKLFLARAARIITADEMPMIGRGVNRRFGPIPSPRCGKSNLGF
ncbi:MAG: hypothetical protein A3J93_03910 [Candidatus Magasanikbacteria bacterium RIFOXYC2_FULL_42_28]|uniref:Uncharacterized protein n=1 Tax=Candidatus Magasanikbacteria bacterium RIFOXYC2_FULL_42_28 TaxID=1798704 RepID=A0A1F6NUN5_9BACT|nr:MAG: hypothetical protein A3J93_03910 [Candidatus Magasanikbacteria bacterium RIFOXYC2_FULL_42_28]